MRGFRRFIPPLIVVLLITTSLASPLTSAQGTASDYCPAGDQDHAPPDPPGDDADRDHVDLVPGNVKLRFPETGAPVEQRGVHLVARSAGNAEVDVDVRNRGDQDAGASSVRLMLERPSGTTTETTVETPAIKAGQTVTVTGAFDLATGRHALSVDVNPDQEPQEACQDARPNKQCGGVTDGCSTTYYDNNKKRVGIYAGGLPVLQVETIEATGPQRATNGPSPDSEAEITVVVTNTGRSAAYNLDALPENSPPFTVRLVVPGCDCETKEVDLPHIPAGASRSVSANFPLHGLRDAFTVKVQLDPYQKTADLDRPHVRTEETLGLPTANLWTRTASDHEQEGETLLVPQGDDVSFDVKIKNHGNATASTTSGHGVRVVVDRDKSGEIVQDTRVVIGAGETATVPVTDSATNLTGKHVYRVRVDPDDEVLEPGQGGNLRFVPVNVALYELSLSFDPDEREIFAPPGVDAAIAFTLKNEGTIADTYRLETPGDPARQHYQDMHGEPVHDVQLAPEETRRLQFMHSIPADAEKESSVPTSLRVRSQGTANAVQENFTFIVGNDSVAPKVHLHTPQSGFLGLDDERIVLEVTDNVAVGTVETDLFGSFQEIEPDDPGGSRYTLDATGTPDRIELNVRATDSADNEDTSTFEIKRDKKKPYIDRVRFAPSKGIDPGDKVNLLVDAYDDNLDRIEIQITQPRPNGTYTENITLKGSRPNHVLRDWRVPERPGHYDFSVTAYDKAGNRAREVERLHVGGLNIEIRTTQPTVIPPEPREGDRVTFTYQIHNTAARHETGEFFVTFNVDDRQQIGLERVNLQPGESRVLQFHWTAQPSPHVFTLVVDQAEEVAEDNDDDKDNLHETFTGVLFPEQELFAPRMIQLSGFDTFGSLLLRYWYIPLLLLVTLGMFGATFVLARRNEET